MTARRADKGSDPGVEFLTVTNNPAVKSKYPHLNLLWVEGGVEEVFLRARDLVHRGYRLLTHPLSSSLKPGRIPYKTVVLTATPQAAVDLTSLELMAAAAEALRKTRAASALPIPERVAADYALVDLSIFESALESFEEAP
ncbi:MAG TPA: hypothetical protein GX511_06060 [Firmicutes bacterium]|nr:hypothetical protein [Bacillota bacterium]